MARRQGRKRKHAKRYQKNGRIQQPYDWQQRDDNLRVGRAVRLLKDDLRKMDDVRRGGALGAAWVRGQIDDAQMNAGERWNILTRRYARILGITLTPNHLVAPLEKIPGESITLEPDDDTVKRIREEYETGFAILTKLGKPILREVNLVAVWNEPVTWAYALQKGLDKLAAYFRIDPNKIEQDESERRIRKFRAHDSRPSDRPDLRQQGSE